MRGPNRDNERRPLPSFLLSEILVCPTCRGSLRFGEGLIVCAHCEESFEQHDQRVVDLLAADRERDPTSWHERQQEMARSYEDLLSDLDHAILGYRNDYTPCAPLMAKYSGRILDVGGGNGIARHFLTPGVDYVLLEPSLEWLDPRWEGLASEFPCLAEPFDFVRGAAEQLPFDDETFDAVLMLWSLNHVSEPRLALREMVRVLRREGRALIVLEDMPPRWLDFLYGGYPHDGNERGRALLQKLRSVFLDWPLQLDHVRILERNLLRWVAPDMDTALRAWLGAYLTFELVRKDPAR